MIRTSPTVGHNRSLRHFVERLERLEEERKTLADDIADIYKEMVSTGFDKEAAKAVLKIRRKEGGLTLWEKRSETVDLYLAELGMIPSGEAEPRARAHAREKIEEFDAETGETTEVSNPQPASSPVTEKAGEASPPVSPATPSPDRAHSAGDDGHLSIPSSEAAGAKSGGTSPVVIGQVGGTPGSISRYSEQAVTTPEPFEPPAFLTKPPLDPINDRCQTPLTCKYGRHPQKLTCSTCKTAWEIAKRRAQAA